MNNNNNYYPPEELVYQALRRDIPYEEKKDLLDALNRAPQLVKDESNPLNFLLSGESCSPKAAAKRLAKYWKFRKICFRERAFLPMNILGNGAMSAEAIKFVKKGAVAILPNDRDGNQVIYIDKRFAEGLPFDVRKQCCFYIIQVATEHMNSRDHKWIIVCSTHRLDFGVAAKETLIACDEAFPGHYVGFHTVLVSPLDGKNLYEYGAYEVLAQFVAIMVNFMGINLARKAKLYSGSKTARQMCARLTELGLREEGIPTLLGGSWGEEQFRSWLMSQLNSEKAKIARWRSVPRGPLQRSLSFDQHQLRTLPDGNQQSYQQQFSPNNFVSPKKKLSKVFNPPQQLQSEADATGRNLLRQDSAISAVSVFEDFATASLPTKSSNLRPGTSRQDLNQYERNGIVLNAFVVENDVKTQEALSRFNEALEMIPEYQKRVYIEAQKQTPVILKSEMDPLRFLRVENFDAWKAARRFCQCWDLRQKLFGLRTFLPMTQTGNGALTHRDIVSLDSGVTASLPKDVSNRGVLLIDRSRSIYGEDEEETESMLRAFFYLLSVYSENQVNQVEGIVCIILVSSSKDIDMGSKVFIQRPEIIKVVPIKTMAVHFVICPSNGERKSAIDKLHLDTIEIGRNLFGNFCIVHRADRRRELHTILKPFGLSESGLPSKIGGKWKYEDFAIWQRQRSQYEETIGCLNGCQRAPRRVFLDTEEERLDRKRKRNIIFSRQKRERRKAESQALQMEHDTLCEENKRLKTENAKLERILKESIEASARLQSFYR